MLKMKQARLFSFNFNYVLFILQSQRPGFILYQQPSYIDRLKRFFYDMQNDPFVFQCMHKLYEHDESTFIHSVDVSFLSLAFSDVFYTDHPANFQKGALLHDIGKYFIPAPILKKKGMLTNEERFTMQHHTIYGHAYLTKETNDYISKLALHHHEHPAGYGYPSNLAGDAMNFDYFVLRLMDEFSALTLDRIYREGLDLTTAQEIIISNIQNELTPEDLCSLTNLLSLLFTEDSEQIQQQEDLLCSSTKVVFSFAPQRQELELPASILDNLKKFTAPN